MSPIAPRYRGPNTSSNDSKTALSPILTIPNLTSIEETSVAYSVEEDSSQVGTDAGRQVEADFNATLPKEGGMQPVLGSMQDSIKRITEKATNSLKRVNNKPFKPVETIRGVLPGIVISISIICLWWIIGRSSPAPHRQDIAQESRSEQASINPIANDPLRAADQFAEATDSPSTTPDTTRDEQLFDHVPFINRPTNETISQSDATQESSTTVPPNDGPQAGTRPGASQPSFPPAQQTEIAGAGPEATPPNSRTSIRPEAPGRAPSARRSTEFEWQRDQAQVAQRAPDQKRENPRHERSMVQPRERQVTAQRSDRNRPVDDRQPQRPYSYQQTDPSTFKDPVYNVPPVARRARSTQR